MAGSPTDGRMAQLLEEEATISPIRNTEGQVNSYVAVKRDITRELQLNGNLSKRKKMDAVGQLAGGGGP